MFDLDGQDEILPWDPWEPMDTDALWLYVPERRETIDNDWKRETCPGRSQLTIMALAVIGITLLVIATLFII